MISIPDMNSCNCNSDYITRKDSQIRSRGNCKTEDYLVAGVNNF